MIVGNFNSTTQEPIQTGITCLLATNTIVLPPKDFDKDFCYCQAVGCQNEYIKAFYGIGDYQNDFFSLFSQVEVSHTVSFKIKKVSTDSEIELVSGVHGVLNNFDANTNQFIVDWGAVSNLLGDGLYELAIQWVYLGATKRKDYKTFLVLPFSADNAEGTIRLTTYQNGEIENGYYFKNFNVFSQIRLNGEVANEQRVTETDSNENLLREKVQVQDREYSEYEILLPEINENILRQVIDYYLVADNISINDYNVFNLNYVNLKVRKTSISLENQSKFYTNLTLKCEDFTTKVKNND